MVPTAPAVMNAIANACGARIRHLPATPDKVLASLAEAKRQRTLEGVVQFVSSRQEFGEKV
jgi:hypothetical protein